MSRKLLLNGVMRELVAALLVLGVTGVVLYDAASGKPISSALVPAWTLIVGTFLGSHATMNGRQQPPHP